MKNYSFIPLLLSIFIFVSCNESGKKKEQSADTTSMANNDKCKLELLDIKIDSCDKPGIDNVLIDPADAQRLMAHFNSTFSPSVNGLQSEYWLEKCEVEALGKFFSDYGAYDGAWIVFLADSTAPHKTLISIVPTVPFHNVNSRHKEEWDAVNKIVFPAGCTTSADHFRSTPDSRIASFRNNHRREGQGGFKDDLSRKVWVSSCVFKALKMIISAYNTPGTVVKLDGIFVYSAAYDNLVSIPNRGEGASASRPNQSTVLLVPGYRCEGSDKPIPAWTVVKSLYTNYKNRVKVAGAAVYNHGELCPSRCNDVE